MTDLVPAPAPRTPAERQQRLERYARKSRSDATWRAYGVDWRKFEAWCGTQGLVALPAAPAVIADYAIHLGEMGHSIRWIRRMIAAIAASHTTAGYSPSPTSTDQVRTVLAGVTREFGRPANKKAAIAAPDIRRLIELTPADTLIGKRDRAILALGYFGAFRRSELVALDRSDIDEAGAGLSITLRRSKTDQDGQGATKGLKRRRDITDPVSRLRDWLGAAEITDGAVFRPIDRHGNVRPIRLTDRSVADIVKAACRRAGLDWTRYSGHSLRRGFATSAAHGGADGLLIRRTTLHKTDRMVMEYIEEGMRFGRHAQDFIDTGEDVG